MLRNVISALGVLALAASVEAADWPQLVRETGCSGGVCLQIGGGDPANAARLAEQGPFLVHCLERDPSRVSEQRRTIADAGLSGRVTVEAWSGKVLPFVDELINLIACEDLGDAAEEELLRVLAPGGTAFLRQGPSYRTLRKPLRPDREQWTHQWHGADGGLVTEDVRTGVPQGVQWIAGPLFAMAGRKSSTQSVVTANGRIFYVTQNVPENLEREERTQFLVARDAFNGVLLWQSPWRGPFVTGDGETNPRLVALDDLLVIAGRQGVEALDAVSGRTLGKVTPTEPSELLAFESRLLVQSQEGLECFDLAGSPWKDCWRFSGGTIEDTVISDHRVLSLAARRLADGRRVYDLLCLNLEDGKLQWRTETHSWADVPRLRIAFADDGYVALVARGSLHVVRIRDGRHLWSRESEASPGKDYSDERYVGHFYRHGLVWMQMENSPREPDGQAVWMAFDPETGDSRRELKTQGLWPRTATPAKMGCQLIVASDQYIMVPRQATFIDLASGEKHGFKFLRGGCGGGIVPANGLVYTHPHACGCFTEAIRGFIAAHPRPTPQFAVDPLSTARLESWTLRGGQAAASFSQPTETDWPTYRYDNRRTACAPTSVPRQLAVRWKADIANVAAAAKDAKDDEWSLRVGNRISAPVVACGLVYVSDVQNHRVVALDQDTGEQRWSFIAGGRIDSPPTIHQDLCVFGSHDGYVYCVNARSGSLNWKFLAAPLDRRIVAFGQLESAWPLAGTVLVQDGTAFVAAGRAPDADDGIRVYALDARTGQPRWASQAAADMVGMCDYPVSDGRDVYLANCRFDIQNGSCSLLDSKPQHLYGGKAGLLEASWTKHDLALRKSIQDWTVRGTAGQLLAFDQEAVMGYRLSEDGKGVLFCTGSQPWEQPVPLPAQLLALAATPERLVSAGGNHRRRDSEAGFLWVHERASGQRTCEIKLPSAPAFDGLALAHGKVYVALQSGCLMALGE